MASSFFCWSVSLKLLCHLFIQCFRIAFHPHHSCPRSSSVKGEIFSVQASVTLGILPAPSLPTQYNQASHFARSLLTPRLQKAISSLTPTEATIFAFVIGAGIGSILHLIFMLFLISIRRMRGLKSKSRQERREARKVRRQARIDKITKAVTSRLGGGSVRLEGGEGEVLPAYGEGEGDRLVQKA